MPSIASLDRSVTCDCVTAEMRAAYPEHSIREHDIFNLGHSAGWSHAADALRREGPEDPAFHGHVREILG